MDIRNSLLTLLLLSPVALIAQTLPTVPVYSYSVPGGGYAPNSNLAAYTDSVTGTWSAQYDNLNRLTGASATGGTMNSLVLGWSYDSFGNRLTQTVSGSPGVPVASAWARYDVNNRMVTNQNAATPGIISYDGAGNMTADGINQMLYDAEDRLCAAQNTYTGQITQYIYDADGNRVAKGHPSGSGGSLTCPTGPSDFVPDATYIVGDAGEQVSELDGGGNWKHSNVYAGGQLLATYDQEGSQQPLHFNITDPLGTRRVQASFYGAAEQPCVSLPFGDGPSCLGATEHFFTGKERDAESGLDYFGARYYGSSMGRFLSPDDGSDQSPGDPQSLNLYPYARNNPIANTDPTGNDCVTQTRNSSTSETVTVNSGSCSGNVGDGQTQTYVSGTVTGVKAGADGHSIDIGSTNSDGSTSVTNAGSAPIPNNTNLAYGWGNNAQGYQMLGAASRAVNTTTAIYAGIYAGAACAVGCPGAAATAMANLRALTGLIPAVPSAIEKLQKLGISLERAREIVQSEEGYVDNANGGMFGTGNNVNYIVNEGGKMIRITTDAAGTKIISAGRVAENFVNRGVASGRLTLR